RNALVTAPGSLDGGIIPRTGEVPLFRDGARSKSKYKECKGERAPSCGARPFRGQRAGARPLFVAERKLRFRSGSGTALRAERAPAEPAHSFGGSGRRLFAPVRLPLSPPPPGLSVRLWSGLFFRRLQSLALTATRFRRLC